MSLRPPVYLSRLIDKKISQQLKIFGAVCVEGTKWCGKTWTVLNHANSITYLMDKGSPEKYLNDFAAFGGIFEGLCLHDLKVYAELYRADLYHYRDNSNLEVDAIMEFPDATWAAFEVKLSEKEAHKGAKTLQNLKTKMEKSGHQPPRCLAVITGTGIAQKRDDGIYTIPIGMLRD